MDDNTERKLTGFKVLVLGGCGFIGRNVVEYLVKQDDVSYVRVTDKVIPAMAWMSKKHREAFREVDFKQCNLINPDSVEKVFVLPEGSSFDYVINCAGETKFEQTDEVYRQGIVGLSVNCAQQAAKCQVKHFVEMSTAHLQSDKKHGSEASAGEPLTAIARFKWEVEERLSQIPGLTFTALRLALVYGPSDRHGLAPRLVIGAVYKYLNETLQILWSKDLKMNTVHVRDVARAAWHVCRSSISEQCINLADHCNTSQGLIAEFVSQIFGIRYEFVGTLASHFAKLQLSDVVADVNEKHVVPWGELCQAEGVLNTPLTPFIFEELLQNKELVVDGSLIESTGFTYEYPKITVELLKEVLADYCEIGIFPKASCTPD